MGQEGRVRSTRSACQARFGALAPARLALETGTPSLGASEWRAELGHEVCERGGKNAPKRALVAVARPLAVLLQKLWIRQQRGEPLYGVCPVTASS
jgi:hypothetical protein